MQTTIQTLSKDVEQLKGLNSSLQAQNCEIKARLGTMRNPGQDKAECISGELHGHAYSCYSRSSAQNDSRVDSFQVSMNQSMTSQAELSLLQKKLIELAGINARFQAENSRLRRERDYFRSLYEINYKNQPTSDRNIYNNRQIESLGDKNLRSSNRQPF